MDERESSLGGIAQSCAAGRRRASESGERERARGGRRLRATSSSRRNQAAVPEQPTVARGLLQGPARRTRCTAAPSRLALARPPALISVERHRPGPRPRWPRARPQERPLHRKRHDQRPQPRRWVFSSLLLLPTLPLEPALNLLPPCARRRRACRPDLLVRLLHPLDPRHGPSPLAAPSPGPSQLTSPTTSLSLSSPLHLASLHHPSSTHNHTPPLSQPFLPPSSPLCALFPLSREWAIRLAALVVLVGLSGVGVLTGCVLVETAARKRAAARGRTGRRGRG